DARDGIDYITLATTGGYVPGYGEALGYLHHYDVVTVRKEEISLAAIPVGKVLDPREMTGALIAETKRFGGQALEAGPEIALSAAGSAASVFQLEISNPTSRPVDFTLNAGSEDSRWTFTPDHRHGTLPAGEKATLEFQVKRVASPIDETFRDPMLTLEAQYLAPGFRYTIPKREIAVPVAFSMEGRIAAPNRALRFDGREDFLRVPSGSFDPGESFTLECRFKADRFAGRTGLVTKTQGSDYGIFVNNGSPNFSVHIAGSYLSVSAPEKVLRTGEWHHLAGIYDGSEARLYLDGELLASKKRQGTRDRNELPLVIGGDVDGAGTATSYFTGLIDYVRVSKIPRYQGSRVNVSERVENDPETCLLLQLDEIIGLRLPDTSASAAHAERCGKPALVPNN
ncbi:MAG: LamG domain-containing protein, partial [Luteolibacter sp.]